MPRPRSSVPTKTKASQSAEATASSTSRRAKWWQIITEPIVCYYGFIVTVVFLMAFGLLMVFSSSTVDLVAAGKSPFSQLISQGTFAVIGLIVGTVAAFVPVKFYQRFSFLALLFAMGLQMLTLVGLGVSSGGNTGWISLGPITFQPAEIMKLALCLWMPQVINVSKTRHLGSVKGFVVPLAFFGLGFLLVLAGKDLGTGLILLLIGAVAIFAGGFSLKAYLLTGAVAAVGIVGVFVLGSSNRMNRISALFSGCTDAADAQGVCYQSIHGLYAIASGGFTGVGLGASREKWNYLPEAHNDFIFAIIGEELGFIGAGVVILGFAILAWCLIVIALKMRNHPYARLVLVCITSWIVGQALINIMVVLKLLPVIGLPLPFISAGGSALVMCLVASGVAVRMAREQDDIAAIFSK
ncbi:MAG: putative lipid II flippase FtsW [Bifidobacteriaceae bacterium]|nr:putative lipid II flippase FtsW [Bifidobacteriaceae bacterium]